MVDILGNKRENEGAKHNKTKLNARKWKVKMVFLILVIYTLKITNDDNHGIWQVTWTSNPLNEACNPQKEWMRKIGVEKK